MAHPSHAAARLAAAYHDRQKPNPNRLAYVIIAMGWKT